MSSDEADLAMREMFGRVNGPTHVYMEPLPLDWPRNVVRQTLELREKAQKALHAGNPDGRRYRRDLLRHVAQANERYALGPIRRNMAKLYYRVSRSLRDPGLARTGPALRRV
jgi:hypothetical protein